MQASVRVVILVANPITYDGRVRRHAATLSEAGYDVCVLGVIGPNDRAEPPLPGPAAPFADGGPGANGWRWQRLDRRPRGLGPRLLWLQSAARQRLAHGLFSLLLPGPQPAADPAPGPEPGPAPTFSLSSVWAQLAGLSVATSAPELALLTLQKRPQIIYANDLDTLPAAAWAARLLGVPYIYDAHEVYVDEHPALGESLRRARACVEGHFASSAAAILTVNSLIATDLQQRYGLPRPAVVRNLPQHATVAAVLPPSARPLGAVGSLHLLYQGAHIGLSQHGVDDILRALSRLRRPGPGQVQAVLTLRGGLSPDEDRRLRERIFALGLTADVRIAPPVPGAEALVAAAAQDGADIGLAVHPPLCLSYVYTTSSKVYEYQLAGLAVGASDVLGNHHSVAPGAGVFYPAGDDAKLADCLRRLASDRQTLRAMQQAAYDHGQRSLRWQDERQILLATLASVRL